MSRSERDLAERALDRARSAGVEEAEACVTRVRFSEIRVQKGKPDRIRVSEEAGVGVRVFSGGRTGFFCTCIPEDLDRGVSELAAAVQLADPDPHGGLADPPPGPYPDLEVFDRKLAGLETRDKIGIMVSLEAEALEADPRIVSRYFIFRDTVEKRVILNTKGLDAEARTTSYTVTGATAVKDERAGTQGFFVRTGRFLEDLTGLGAGAARRALRTFGGKPFPPHVCTAVFDPLLSAELIGEISPALLGRLDVLGESFLSGRTGEAVASPAVTLVDDLGARRKPATRPFDGDGLPPQRTVVVEGGVLKTFLYDSYWGRRAGKASTANAGRAGYRSRPFLTTTNLMLEPGTLTPEEIIASVDDGILLFETLNVGGVNVASGDYSVAGSGIRIEKGELAGPVGGITVAGKLPDMLRNIEAVGKDVSWFTDVGAPTLAVSGLTIGG